VRVSHRYDSVVDDEADLLGDVAGGAVQDLSGEVRCERNLLGSHETVLSEIGI